MVSLKQEYSLTDVLLRNKLPLTVRISRQCVMNKKSILKTGQFVTILDCQRREVLEGADWNGKRFAIYGNRCRNMLINIVEEFFPKKDIEFADLSTKINLLLLKQKVGYHSWVFEPGESFSMKDNNVSQVDIRKKDEQDITLVREKDGKEVSMPLSTLLNDKFFKYARIIEQKKVDSLNYLSGKSVHFLNSLSSSSNIILPIGILNIQYITPMEIISTVTIPTSSRYILYESYPVDSRIMVYTSNKMPKHIALLGEKGSEVFKEKLDEVDFLSFYDSYSSRFYGHYIEENPYQLADWELQMEEFKNSIHDNLLFTRRTIPTKHVCKLHVNKPLLERLSKLLLFKQSLGRISSSSPEKEIRLFDLRMRTKDGANLLKSGALNETAILETDNSLGVCEESISCEESGHDYTSLSYFDCSQEYVSLQGACNTNDEYLTPCDADNQQGFIARNFNPLYEKPSSSNDVILVKGKCLEDTNPLYIETDLKQRFQSFSFEKHPSISNQSYKKQYPCNHNQKKFDEKRSVDYVNAPTRDNKMRTSIEIGPPQAATSMNTLSRIDRRNQKQEHIYEEIE